MMRPPYGNYNDEVRSAAFLRNQSCEWPFNSFYFPAFDTGNSVPFSFSAVIDPLFTSVILWDFE